MKFISLLFIISTILIYPTISYSQFACFNKGTVESQLKKYFNEVPFWTGREAVSKSEVRMYLNPDKKSFTITLISLQNPNIECMVLAGKDFGPPRELKEIPKKKKKGSES